jgi:hypothetical protein
MIEYRTPTIMGCDHIWMPIESTSMDHNYGHDLRSLLNQ